LTTADGIIFASPNHYDKVSAAFKNAYDWISFTQNPQMPSPIREKPAAFMVCSLGDGHKTV
jgi:NAD(P)H-dependent FMN reductase